MCTVADIETDPNGAKDLAAILGNDFRVIHCPECGKALRAAQGGGIQAFILDLGHELCDPFALLDTLAHMPGSPPVIAVAGPEDPHAIVRAIRCGAIDVLSKEAAPSAFKGALARCIGDANIDADTFAGRSEAVTRLRGLFKSYAPWDFPILITGESGTGKDLAARVIHEHSRRHHESCVTRNCAALPSALIESELFGTVKGAFTGALDRPGAFELADKGTLFLDEIGDASQETQAKLLRALESRAIWRLGGRSTLPVDVRFLSATSRDLDEAVVRGAFRLDLLYRIETLRIHIPPLRERKEDIPDLAWRFVREVAYGDKDLAASAIERLQEEDWPGNVRQLRNAVQRAIVMSGGRETILAEDVVVY